MKKYLSTTAFVLCFLSGLSYAAGTETEVKIVTVGFYGEGRVFVSLDTVIEDPDCPGKARFDVAANHPSIDKVLSVGIAAH